MQVKTHARIHRNRHGHVCCDADASDSRAADNQREAQEKRRRYDSTGRAEKTAEEEFVEGFGGSHSQSYVR